MGQNCKITSFSAQRTKKASAEGQSPPQELEVGPRSGPYLLVDFNGKIRVENYGPTGSNKKKNNGSLGMLFQIKTLNRGEKRTSADISLEHNITAKRHQ